MIRWIRAATAASGIALCASAGGGCSEAVGPSEGAIAPDASAEVRVRKATEAAAPQVSAETQTRIDAYTADAVASLKRSADFLAAQENVSFLVDVAYDVLQPNGQMLEFGGTRDILMHRPDRLRIESVDRGGRAKLLYFDGASILIDLPTEDAFVRVEKPGTLYAAMDYLVDDLGAHAPLEDFTSRNFAAEAVKIESGFFVQRVMLDDYICEQLAWRTADVDVQLWVREGEEPVPCRMVITYKKAEGNPQFVASFHGWNFAPDVDDDLFSFTPPDSAERLQVQALIQDLNDEMEGN